MTISIKKLSKIIIFFLSSFCPRTCVVLCVDVPPNDQCQDAIGPLTLNGTVTLSATRGATTNSSSLSFFRCGGQVFDVSSAGVWFRVVGTGNRFIASTCSEYTNFPHRITLFRGESCSSRSCIDSEKEQDMTCSVAVGTAVKIGWNTQLNENYFILVHNTMDELSGEFGLTVDQIPIIATNNDCIDAISISSKEKGTTVGASVDNNVQCGGVGQNNIDQITTPGVWYHIPATDMDNIEAVLSLTYEASVDFSLLVFSGGTNCDNLVCIQNDVQQNVTMNSTESITTREFTFMAQKEQTYQVYVYAIEDEVVGEFDIEIQLISSPSTTTVPMSASYNQLSFFFLYTQLVSCTILLILVAGF